VVAMFSAELRTEGAEWWDTRIEEGQAELLEEQEAVYVGEQSGVVGEAGWQGVQWHAMRASVGRFCLHW
jgi:hypothetical protein